VTKPPAGRTLADRFRAHARALVTGGRSPLYAELMAAAADDLDRGGVVARLFAGLPAPRGSVPQLRLMAALHELVLAGSVPELARFYPSAGGERPPQGAWPWARAALNDHFDWIRERLPRTVQTNEVGRSTVLYGVLLWLADASERRLRLLEIGASAGLNLRADRYAYDVGEAMLGDPSSAVRFQEPWRPGPQIDLAAAQDRCGSPIAPAVTWRRWIRRWPTIGAAFCPTSGPTSPSDSPGCKRRWRSPRATRSRSRAVRPASGWRPSLSAAGPTS
jgi:hypothetical protein